MQTLNYEFITKVAEKRIDQKAHFAIDMPDLKYEFFSHACEVHSFWEEMTAGLNKKEDYDRLMEKTNNILL